MKIKTKKEMNLPELIEWGFKNDIKEKSFIAYECVEDQRHEVHFNALGIPKFSAFIKKSNTFTVEVEEEITLTTPLPDMLHVWKTGILGTEIKEVQNKSIASQYTVCSTEFWLKQDDEMTLIWRDGRLIE